MDAQQLFLDRLSPVYEATRRLLLELGGDVVEKFSKTQVSFGSARKFAWLTPVTKTSALLTVDLWEERTAPQLLNVIRYRLTSSHTKSRCEPPKTSKRSTRSAG